MDRFLIVSCIILSMFVFAAVHAQTSYQISSPSKVLISGTSTLSDWVVKSEGLSGEMTFTPSGEKAQKGAFQAGIVRHGQAVLEVSTIRSEKGETMDNKIYNALRNDAYPRITFVLTDPISLSNASRKATATGTVQIAGVTRPMTFELEVDPVENVFHFYGSRSLKWTEFGIEPPTAMFGQIVTGDDISVTLDLYFYPSK